MGSEELNTRQFVGELSTLFRKAISLDLPRRYPTLVEDVFSIEAMPEFPPSGFSVNQQEVKLLLRLRIVLETTVALDIANLSQEKKTRRLKGLLKIHRRIGDILEKESLTDKDSDLAWELDVKLHAELCRAADYPTLALVFEAFQNRIREWAKPKDARMLADTFAEHDAILIALQANRPNEDAVCRAVANHIHLAGRRWFPDFFADEEVDSPTDTVDSPFDPSRIDLDAAAATTPSGTPLDEPLRRILQHAVEDLHPSSREGAELLIAGLCDQYRYPGEFVAYRDHWSRENRGQRLRREILAHDEEQTAVFALVESLSPADQRGVVVDYQPVP